MKAWFNCRARSRMGLASSAARLGLAPQNRTLTKTAPKTRFTARWLFITLHSAGTLAELIRLANPGRGPQAISGAFTQCPWSSATSVGYSTRKPREHPPPLNGRRDRACPPAGTDPLRDERDGAAPAGSGACR